MCKRKIAWVLFANSQTRGSGGEEKTKNNKAGYGARLLHAETAHSQHAVSWWMVVNMVVTWLEMTSLLNVYIESILYPKS